MEDFYYNCCDKIQMAIEKYIESTGYKPTEITMNECDFEKLKSICKIQVEAMDDITHIFGLKINTSKYIEPLTFNLTHMKTHKITEDQIREAHAEACSDWKTKIETWFPDMYKRKSGWYLHNTFSKWLVYIDLENDVFYGFDPNGIWFFQDNGYGRWLDREYPATPEEVEKRLIEEAKRKEFVEGVRFNSLKSNRHPYEEDNTKVYGLTYHYEKNSIFTNRGVIFHNGQWAEIVEEETYSIGDRFEHDGRQYVLCTLSNKEAGLMDIKYFKRWSRPIEVNNLTKITKQEFTQITDNYEFKKI